MSAKFQYRGIPPSAPTIYLDGRVAAHAGDCLAIVKTLADNSIDACVCDPPYALVSISKRFGADSAAPCKPGKTGAYQRASAGFMGKRWDTGETAFAVEFWSEVWRVLKPGAHVVAFGGTRTYHRLACAIEDAGFECRDAVMWHYGVGFPKSHDVSKGIDKAAGAEREIVGIAKTNKGDSGRQTYAALGEFRQSQFVDVTAPATDAAREWAGWGTALKPATEIIFVGRKPLSEGTIAANVLRWKCGALNINGCRVHANNNQSECGSSREESARRQCPVHGMRVMQDDYARVEEQGEKGEVADKLQSEMPRGLDEGREESPLRQGCVVRHPHGLSEVESRQAVERGHFAFADPDSSGLFGAPNGDGAALKARVVSGRERSSHQWEQVRQSDRESNADRLDVSRAGAREDRAHNDRAEEGKRDSARCTCGSVASGRWPANLCHDNSPEVLAAFPQADSARASGNPNNPRHGSKGRVATSYDWNPERESHDYRDTGSAARFFYSAKATKGDRIGSKHPTVKPVKLMQWLCRLVTPPGGTILDPFSGTGTTGAAAYREGFNAILCEREAEYLADIDRRMKLLPDQIASESTKAKVKVKPVDDEPQLFDEERLAA